jgi:hypothetical protein
MKNSPNHEQDAEGTRMDAALAYMHRALEILDAEDPNAACYLSLAIEVAGGKAPLPAPEDPDHSRS